jgi:hypothetical protein
LIAYMSTEYTIAQKFCIYAVPVQVALAFSSNRHQRTALPGLPGAEPPTVGEFSQWKGALNNGAPASERDHGIVG